MWNTDRPGWGETSDPLYITVPFFISLRSGHAYGIFLDNTYRSSFDFGVESSSDYSFGADDGELQTVELHGLPERAFQTVEQALGQLLH